jgi:hypothetical protein
MMQKMILILTAALGLTMSAQAGGSAKWNSLFQRWEYTDDSGYSQTSKYNSLF